LQLAFFARFLAWEVKRLFEMFGDALAFDWQ
jgi:hypothetical protein